MSAVDFLMDVTGIKTELRDFPICENCFKILRDFYHFKHQAKRAKAVFELLLHKVDGFSDSKPYSEPLQTEVGCPAMQSELLFNAAVIDGGDIAADDSSHQLVESKVISFELENNETGMEYDELNPETCAKEEGVEEITIQLSVERVEELQENKEPHHLHFGASDKTENFEEEAVCTDSCGSEFDNNQADAVRQVNKRHPGNKKFQCNECGSEFSHSQSLSRHMNSHKPKKQYMCEFCGKVFLRTDDRRRHERVHTGERPYICKICKKAFKQSGELKEHQLVHYKHKHFECEICGHRLSSRNGLYMHKKRHGFKENPCLYCNKIFFTKGELKSHTRIHEQHDEDECGEEVGNE